jgi:hypothetical protein
MLIPALVPLCAGSSLAHEVGLPESLALAVTTVGIHTAAMLFTTGLVATSVCRGVGVRSARSGRKRLQ